MIILPTGQKLATSHLVFATLVWLGCKFTQAVDCFAPAPLSPYMHNILFLHTRWTVICVYFLYSDIKHNTLLHGVLNFNYVNKIMRVSLSIFTS